METLPPLLTSEQLQALTARHLARYVSMLRAAARGIQGIPPGETQVLIDIWSAIEKRDGSIVSTDYTPEQIAEIQDAWFDEYDGLDSEAS